MTKPATERAIDAYCRLFGSARRYGGNFPVPSTHKTKQVGDVVEVRNRNGLLAKYKVMPSGQVRRIHIEDHVLERVYDSFQVGDNSFPIQSVHVDWEKEGF